MAGASPLHIKAEPVTDPPLPISLRPKFKISDLPLNKEQRTAIDALLYKIKKKGTYDTLRKKVWADYNASDEPGSKPKLTSSIQDVADIEIDKDPNLLSRERGKAATLIQGAVDRSGVYHDVEVEMDRLIAGHLETVLSAVREIRRADVGDEKARDEEVRGRKTDEEYTAETEARGAEREKNRARMEELTRAQMELKAKIKAAEEKQAREALQKKEDEERKLWEESEAQRKADKERRREEQKRAAEEYEKERQERQRKREEERKARHQDHDRERDRDRDPERDRERDRDYTSSAYRSRHHDDARDLNLPVQKAKAEQRTQEDLDKAALEALLDEGRREAEKAKQKPAFDFEKAEELEANPRKAALAKRMERSDRSSSHRRSSYDDRRERKRSRSRSRGKHRSKHEDDDARPAKYVDIEAVKLEERREREREAAMYMQEGHTSSIAPSHSSVKLEDVEMGEVDEEKPALETARSPYRKSHQDDDDRDKRHSSRRERSRDKDESRAYKRPRIERSASPLGIDRYVPGGGRRKDPDRDKDRDSHKDRDRERHRDREERPRDRDRDRDRERDYDRERYRDKDRYKERDRERRRSRSPHRRDDRRHRDRDRSDAHGDKKKYVEIDRYVPGR